MAKATVPSSIVALAMCAAGAAVTCSAIMLHDVVEYNAGGLTGNFLSWLIVFAIIGGAAATAKLIGALSTVRSVASFGMAACIVGWMFLESVSIGSSVISMRQNLAEKSAAEKANSSSGQATNSTIASISNAITAATANMNAMPDRYVTRKAQAASNIEKLVQQQQQMQQMQDTRKSSVDIAFEGREWLYSIAVAIALSTVTCSVMFGLSSLQMATQGHTGSLISDKFMREGYKPPDKPSRITGDGNVKKSRGLLHLVSGGKTDASPKNNTSS